MKIKLLKTAGQLLAFIAVAALAQSVYAAKPSKVIEATQPKAVAVGDDAQILGSILRIWIYSTEETGSEITRYLVSRPLIDGQQVRSAYLTACTGPTEKACQADGYDMVYIEPAVTLGTSIEAYGLVTQISEKLYYSTYYMNATSDIVER